MNAQPPMAPTADDVAATILADLGAHLYSCKQSRNPDVACTCWQATFRDSLARITGDLWATGDSTVAALTAKVVKLQGPPTGGHPPWCDDWSNPRRPCNCGKVAANQAWRKALATCQAAASE